MKHLEQALKALADQNRLRIIGLLAHQKFCVCELAFILKITQPSVSKHLKKLKAAKMIDSEQDGFWTNYFIQIDLSKNEKKIWSLFVSHLGQLPQIKEDIKRAKKANKEKLCCS